MNQLLHFAVKTFYLPHKNRESLKIHRMTPKNPLPVVGLADDNGNPSMTLVNSINTRMKSLKYVPDPLNGAYDFYNPAEFTQWQIDNNDFRHSCDCDDFAAYGYGLALNAKIGKNRVSMQTLVVDFGSILSKMWANHVILTVHYSGWDGEWTACIDTNSVARERVFWIKGLPSDSQVRDNIMKLYGEIYKVKYGALVESEYPF